MRSMSRYFATVRRATSMPSWRSSRVSASSLTGLPADSAAIRRRSLARTAAGAWPTSCQEGPCPAGPCFAAGQRKHSRGGRELRL